MLAESQSCNRTARRCSPIEARPRGTRWFCSSCSSTEGPEVRCLYNNSARAATLGRRSVGNEGKRAEPN